MEFLYISTEKSKLIMSSVRGRLSRYRPATWRNRRNTARSSQAHSRGNAMPAAQYSRIMRGFFVQQ